jgi:hypothetical protein
LPGKKQKQWLKINKLQAKPDKFQVLAVGKKIFIFNILISRVISLAVFCLTNMI